MNHAVNRMTGALELPKDILYGEFRIRMIGNLELWVENYKGIVDYTENRIVLQGKHLCLAVQGKQLSIEYYTNEDMKITGRIHCLQYI